MRRLVLVLALLVVVPAVTLAVLGGRMIADRHKVAEVELTTLLDERLADLERTLSREMRDVEQELRAALDETGASAEGLRGLRRRVGLVAQTFALDDAGRLSFPPEDISRSTEEGQFVSRTQEIWQGRAVLYHPPQPEPDTHASGKRAARAPKIEGDDLNGLAARQSHGWVTWYWQDGLRLLFWQRSAQGGVLGAEIERVVLLGRLLGRLPELPLAEDCVRLVDSRKDTVHQWGPFDPPAGHQASATRRLPYPLDGYRLEYHLAPSRTAALLGGSDPWGSILGLVAAVLVILALGVYVYREASRQMRDAAQRVTFVTQVSHELKTPLSNIRLYAELLEHDLEDVDEAPKRRVGIIVSEAQRLGRLIDNILVYAKVRRGTHRVKRSEFLIDDAVRRVLAQFAPALAVKGIEPAVVLGAPRPCLADPDAVEQILANLIGNVEKYAAEGGALMLTTRQDDLHTTIEVGDRGPGIPRSARHRVFDPFFRVSDRLADGVTGTGIGLAIARTLAEENGGSLTLLERQPGAWFELQLPTGGAGGEGE